jgi:membrane protein DedA with SNARE-associated domain
MMSDLSLLIAQHGYLIIFLIVFVEAIGLPLPAALALVAGGAAAASGTLRLPMLLLSAIAAMLLGDSLLYFLGNRTGWALLGLLCRVSANPETCILRSAQSFYKRGRPTLLVAKFIPGVNAMAAPLAGSMKMPFEQFLGLDFAGAMLYALAYAGIGFLFRDFLAAIIRGFRAAGHATELVTVTALIAYVLYRVWLYHRYRMDRMVPRVQVLELAALLESEGAARILVADVRSHGYYDAGAIRIRGSIRMEPNNLLQAIAAVPRDKDVYLYCT